MSKNKPRDLSKWLLKREGISLSREEIMDCCYMLGLRDRWILARFEGGWHVQKIADACDVHISAIYRRLEKVAKVLYRVSTGGSR